MTCKILWTNENAGKTVDKAWQPMGREGSVSGEGFCDVTAQKRQMSWHQPSVSSAFCNQLNLRENLIIQVNVTHQPEGCLILYDVGNVMA